MVCRCFSDGSLGVCVSDWDEYEELWKVLEFIYCVDFCVDEDFCVEDVMF